MYFRVGGSLVSCPIPSLSHWFNRLPDEALHWDVDLTGDQFGLPAVRVALAGTLYEQTRLRSVHELNTETLQRARVLAARAGLGAAVASIDTWLATKTAAAADCGNG